MNHPTKTPEFEGIKNFTAGTFWDVDLPALDPEKHKRFIVRRVIEHGLWQDFLTLRKLYTMADIRQALQGGRPLRGKAAALAENLIANETDQSLQGRIEGVKVEFLLHEYERIGQHETREGIRLWAMEDVAAMKLNALNNRGAKKDFYDVAQLLRHLSLADLLDLFARKYKNTDRMSIMRSLVYFADAEDDPDPLEGLRDWEEIKQNLRAEQRKLAQNL